MLCPTVKEMKSIDNRAITRHGIPGLLLMENAGRGVARVIENRFDLSGNPKVTIVCGTGNNGGDGMVVCRHLRAAGALAKCFLLGKKQKLRGDAKTNLDILESTGFHVVEMESSLSREFTEHLQQSDLIVDAIFGTGFQGGLKGLTARVVERICSSGIPIVAVDCPSGVNSDDGKVESLCVKATVTVTMCLPKTGLFLYPGREAVGELWIADIGVPESIVGEAGVVAQVLESHEVVLPHREPAGYKTTFGQVAVISGSVGMTGAGAMASCACLRCGAGMVTLCLPESLNIALEAKLTAVMTYPLPETSAKTLSLDALRAVEPLLRKADVIAIGPGLSTHPETEKFVCSLVQKVRLPMVVDADAINAMRGRAHLFRKRKAPTIVTPHPGEMARLIGLPASEIMKDRLGISSRCAAESGAVTVLKGAPTVIASPDGKVFINPKGNSGLATAGSGDVLTGIIAGMLCQGLEPVEAAKTGVYLHGLAGDIVADRFTEYGLVATDLLEAIPSAIQSILDCERDRLKGGVRRIL
jgi:NAD(P)H-hydrate epimerase